MKKLILLVVVVALLASQVLINTGMAVALLISVSQHHPYLLEIRPFEYRKKPVEKQALNDYPEGLPPLFEKP